MELLKSSLCWAVHSAIFACMTWALVLLFSLECVWCIHEYVFVCVHICVCVRESHVCTCIGRSEVDVGCLSVLLSLLFWNDISHWTWSSLIQQNYLISELQGSPCVCLLSAMIIEACHHAWQFMCFLGIWTEGTVLLNKHFASWAIPSCLAC